MIGYAPKSPKCLFFHQRCGHTAPPSKAPVEQNHWSGRSPELLMAGTHWCCTTWSDGSPRAYIGLYNHHRWLAKYPSSILARMDYCNGRSLLPIPMWYILGWDPLGWIDSIDAQNKSNFKFHYQQFIHMETALVSNAGSVPASHPLLRTPSLESMRKVNLRCSAFWENHCQKATVCETFSFWNFKPF